MKTRVYRTVYEHGYQSSEECIGYVDDDGAIYPEGGGSYYNDRIGFVDPSTGKVYDGPSARDGYCIGCVGSDGRLYRSQMPVSGDDFAEVWSDGTIYEHALVGGLVGRLENVSAVAAGAACYFLLKGYYRDLNRDAGSSDDGSDASGGSGIPGSGGDSSSVGSPSGENGCGGVIVFGAIVLFLAIGLLSEDISRNPSKLLYFIPIVIGAVIGLCIKYGGKNPGTTDGASGAAGGIGDVVQEAMKRTGNAPSAEQGAASNASYPAAQSTASNASYPAASTYSSSPSASQTAGGTQLSGFNKYDETEADLFFNCGACGARFLVPKGRGTVVATCPKCGNRSTIDTGVSPSSNSQQEKAGNQPSSSASSLPSGNSTAGFLPDAVSSIDFDAAFQSINSANASDNYVYYTCACGQRMRFPVQKGTIKFTCPRCKREIRLSTGE